MRNLSALRFRVSSLCLVLSGVACLFATGCASAPPPMLRQSQLQAQRYYRQSQQLAAERDALAAERQQLAQQAARLQSDLKVANQRLDNLANERSTLQQRYVSLLKQSRKSNPLSAETTRRFEDLARRYPNFEFDPQTGVSKFHSDVLFDSGSAVVKGSADPVLREFAEIMNEGDAKRLNVLVVGHTDDKPIKKASTRSKHPTNWHLSTNRANSVLLKLKKHGLQEDRMGSAGYGEQQPLVPNTDDRARQRNRRVEIFVLAPDAVVAGWDPMNTSRR